MVLTTASRECGSIGTTELKSKDHIYAWTFVKQFLDQLGCDVEMKSDSEPTTKYICEQVKKTVATTSGNYAHEELGATARAHSTVQAQMRALRSQRQKDSGCLLRPGEVLFERLARYAGWSLTCFGPRAATKQTA